MFETLDNNQSTNRNL